MENTAIKNENDKVSAATTRRVLTWLEYSIKELYDLPECPSSEYRKDKFEPCSGQFARISWYVPNEEKEIALRFFKEYEGTMNDTYTITIYTPEGSTRTSKLEVPELISEIANNSSEFANFGRLLSSTITK